MGPLATKLLGALHGKTNIFEGVSTIISKVKADPTKVAEMENDLEQLRLKNEESNQQIALELERISLDEYKAMLADTDSARKMNEKIQGDKPSWLARNIGYLIDILLALVWSTLTVVIAMRQLRVVTIEGADFTGVLSLYATVTAVFMSSVNFHRGSTQTSRDKQKALDKMQEKMLQNEK